LKRLTQTDCAEKSFHFPLGRRCANIAASIAAREVVMNEIRRLREAVGASQIRIAKLAGMSRMRLSLAETGDVGLSPEEVTSVRKAIATFATNSAAELEKIARLAAAEV
jgi:DNA-binding XRE family transcriptional regulator